MASPKRSPGLSRREWLTMSALFVAGCDSSAPSRGMLGAMERVNERVQRLLLRPGYRAPEPDAREQTPLASFPVYHLSDEIPLAPDGWMLRIGGAVERPLTLRLADLQRMPRTDIRVRHYCVEGWSAVASWHGVALREIAARAGADPAAPYVEFRSFDQDYSSSWDRPSALHAQTLLAYGMNGAPLAPAHGAPVRLYSAVKLGYKLVKYLTEVNFLPNRTGGYWEDQGYEWFAGV